MHWWYVGAAANAVVFAAYLAISLSIARGLTRTRQWRKNPLGAATAGIFFTCAVHHGSHTVHQLLPYAGLDKTHGVAMRKAFDFWQMSGWDIATAAVGVWYWTLRNRFPALVRGTAIFEDVRQRQRQALEIHDNVVQGLATAKLSFELDRPEEGLAALERTLEASRRIITGLLGESGSELELQPGDLRRETPARA